MVSVVVIVVDATRDGPLAVNPIIGLYAKIPRATASQIRCIFIFYVRSNGGLWRNLKFGTHGDLIGE